MYDIAHSLVKGGAEHYAHVIGRCSSLLDIGQAE